MKAPSVLRTLPVAALALAAAVAHAQPEQRPFVYSSGGLGPLTAGRGSQMAVVHTLDPQTGVPRTPLEAAINAKATLDAQLLSGATHPDHICILLHNFGSYGEPLIPTRPDTSFFQDADKLTNPAPVWENPQAPHSPSLYYLQPWLTAGIPKVTDWMDDFCREFKALLPVNQRPVRFHFDSENSLIGCCDVDPMRIIDAVVRQVDNGNSRWNSSPVPGSALSPGGPRRTMAEQYDGARIKWGFPADPLHAFNPDLTCDHDYNRAFYLWYHGVCQRAMDAAMNEAAYKVIKEYWPDCLVSNYEDINADGKEDTFGWYYGKDRVTHAPGVVVQSVRGQTPRAPSGNENTWGDMVDPQGNQSLWFVTGATASGDFSAPVLYTHHPSFAAIPDPGLCCECMNNTFVNPYLSPYLDQNKLSIYDTSLFIHRRTIEGIINSPGGNPAKIAPWVLGIGEVSDQNHCHLVTPDHFVNQLAMCRAKKIRELLLYFQGTGANWEFIKSAIDAVYTPQLYWVSAGLGTPTTGMELDRIRYTLRQSETEGPETMEFESERVNDSDLVTLIASFSFPVAEPVAQLQLNLECDVTDPNVQGKIFAFDGTGWNQFQIDDFPSPSDDFGFFAPVDPINGLWYQTRRTFYLTPQNTTYIWSDGVTKQLVIQIVLRRSHNPLVTNPFGASFDLVQVVAQQATQASDSTSVDTLGADFDFSGTVGFEDLTAFYDAWLSQSPAADSNCDGVVDTDDLAAFLVKYSS